MMGRAAHTRLHFLIGKRQKLKRTVSVNVFRGKPQLMKVDVQKSGGANDYSFLNYGI